MSRYNQRNRRAQSWIALLGIVLLLGLTQTMPAVALSRWTTAASMGIPREMHAATVLQNGKVLVSGGWASLGSVGGAELYDPSSNSWDDGGLISRRFFHTMTLLKNGKVLMVGGRNSSTVLASVQLYDPSTNGWSDVAPLATARQSHTATLLDDGKVLVVGGLLADDSAAASSELYDPSTNSWSGVGSMTSPRFYHTAHLLSNGKVLVTGGGGAGIAAQASVELYDPLTRTWSTVAPMKISRSIHASTLLQNGKVLVAGGFSGTDALNGSVTVSGEVYDPATNIWNDTGPLAIARQNLTANLLPNGRVVVIGGYAANGDILASAELYEPSTNAWTPAGSMSVPRLRHTSSMLQNGRVLVAGGSGAVFYATAELYEDAPSGIQGDVNQDWTVNVVDLSLLLARWNQKDCGNMADLNKDCSVDITDLSILLRDWGKTSASAGNLAPNNPTKAVRRQAASAGQAQLALQSSAARVPPGGTFTVTVNLNTGGNPTDGTDAVLLFDASKLKVESVNAGSLYPSSPSPTIGSGRVHISGAVSSPTSPKYSGSGVLATVTFSVLPTAVSGDTPIRFDFDPTTPKTNDSNVVWTDGMGSYDALTSASGTVITVFAPLGLTVSQAPQPPSGGPALTTTLTARVNCDTIDHIDFGTAGMPLANARVTITSPSGGPANQTAGFTYRPPSGTTSVSLIIQRVVQSGSATVNPILFNDGCGEWRTFVGGGPNAFH